MWLQQSLNRFYEERNGQETIDLHVLLEFMAFSYHGKADFKSALDFTNKLIAVTKLGSKNNFIQANRNVRPS